MTRITETVGLDWAVKDYDKEAMDKLDKSNIRTQFKQASDPIYLAFNYMESRPLNKIASETIQETFLDLFNFVAKAFVA